MSLLIAPLEALIDPRLSDSERRVLLALYSFRNKNADTVWPELPTLAERALIKDIPRVSKLTNSLRELGWLEKKKRSFSAGNEYFLKVPEFFDANLANNANLVDAEFDADSPASVVGSNDGANANLVNIAKLEESPNANLAEYTKPNLAYSAKRLEQQKEQQKEHQTKPASGDASVGKKTRFDPRKILFPDLLNIPAWLEWCDARTARKKPISIKAAESQIKMLVQCTAEVQSLIITQSIANDWQGLFPPKIGDQHHGDKLDTNFKSNSAVGRVKSAIARNAEARDCEETVPC